MSAAPFSRFVLLLLACWAGWGGGLLHAAAAGGRGGEAAGGEAVFPVETREYARMEREENERRRAEAEGAEVMLVEGIWEKVKFRARHSTFNLIATGIFLCAIVHTFMAARFMRLAHYFQEKHLEKIRREGRTADAKPQADARDDVCFWSIFFHFLGEVEAVFGIWLIPLFVTYIAYFGWGALEGYTGVVNYTEPMFVVVIMAISASRPVLRFAEKCLLLAAKLGRKQPAAWWLSILTLAPVLGSFITEPAAMTIGALLLGRKFYELKPSRRFAYATLGLLFVNVSVGGTLTNFAAPPVLMISGPGQWDWSTMFMMTHFGWKAVLGILLSNVLYFLLFRREWRALNLASMAAVQVGPLRWRDREDPVPAWITLMHLLFLGWTILTAHAPALFIGGFLFFLAFVEATEHHQNAIGLRGPLLVGFFLAALVTHGNFQGWWIDPIITQLGEVPLMIGATVLTAFNDNAAITYLASQAADLAEASKYAVVAGAVTGGGLTVIANAPNPAGQSILRRYFQDGISPMGLFLGAVIPTVVMGFFFMLL
ncbi:MAG TPA: putative Na+/H+ antiporter [Verrucomicrobiales bacterium]|nr:putative Na+/H+ antiporter [Verrucomicrobiales bacterium]